MCLFSFQGKQPSKAWKTNLTGSEKCGIISKVSEFCNTASQTPSINVETLGDTLGGGTGTDSVIDAIIVWRA